MAESLEKIRIIAQPKAEYRERYSSEVNPDRAQRFIRADENPEKHEYPTIEIPSEWRDADKQYYVRVTLVTVPYGGDNAAPCVCVHPYELDTKDKNVRKESATNSLYFPITEEAARTGRMSFKISRKKMLRHDLKSYGPLRILDSNQYDIIRVPNPQDPKQVIVKYHLWDSQLVFSIATISNRSPPVIMAVTTVFSQVTTAAQPPNDDEAPVRYAPKKGCWQGGDEVLMTIPHMDKRKPFSLHFEFSSNPGSPSTNKTPVSVQVADAKTIVFQTPPCPVLVSIDNQSFVAEIVGMQADEEILRVPFTYLTGDVFSTNLCPRCRSIPSPEDNNRQGGRKRPYPPVFDDFQVDTPIVDVPNKVHKFVGQLQSAVVNYVRTNDPTELFRRTSALIAGYKGDSPPLHDAIREGHIDLASTLIEQATKTRSYRILLEQMNKDGETPLLFAAKCNQWTLIKLILSKHPIYADQIDPVGNNLLHLLAAISNDDGYETLSSALSALSFDIRTILISTANKNNLTPADVAEINQNDRCTQLLSTYMCS